MKKNFRKSLCLMLSMLTLAAAPAALADAATAAPEATSTYEVGDTFSLTIMNTHDIHGHVDSLPQYATYIDMVKSSVDNVLVMDGGDTFRRGELEQFQGIMEAEIFNAIGYDVCTLGNHEFNVPAEEKTADDCNAMISAIAETNEAPIVCANVKYKESGEYLDGVEPYTILERDGVRIGVIGMTSMKPANREMAEVTDKDFLNATETLTACLAELEGQTDINIVLSHTGIVEDINMGQLGHTSDWSGYSYQIAAIMSADDHLMLSKPLFFYYGTEKGIPIFQHGGEANHTLGRLDLEFEVTEEGFKLVDHEGYVCDVSAMEPDVEIEGIIAGYRELAAEQEKAAA